MVIVMHVTTQELLGHRAVHALRGHPGARFGNLGAGAPQVTGFPQRDLLTMTQHTIQYLLFIMWPAALPSIDV